MQKVRNVVRLITILGLRAWKFIISFAVVQSSLMSRVKQTSYDAIVVGSGPNGLAAAITVAQAGLSVLLLEARETTGGSCRSAELTLPGFVHDTCSAIHPLGLGSPLFRSLPLHDYGLQWIESPAPLAHPFDDGTAAVLERSIEDTGRTLGMDEAAYRRFFDRLIPDWDRVSQALLNPLMLLSSPAAIPRFGLLAMRSSKWITDNAFAGPRARALFAGIAGHSGLPLEMSPSAAIGLVLNIAAHAVGWPLPLGGSQKLADSLTAYLVSLGGEVLCHAPVESIDELPKSRILLCDITPTQLIKIAGHRLPSGYIRQLRSYRYGPAVFKIDLAIDGPIPWQAAACARAATVHLGASAEEIALAEHEVWDGKHPERPFVLVAQQSLFDATRAPAGKHTVWAYCHVPLGSAVDMTERIECQIERFAPGFRDRILARATRTPAQFEQQNPNCVGGDINGGTLDWMQLVTRPTPRLVPFSTPIRGLYLCSASTPPGGGVHGMCGYYAALTAMKIRRLPTI